MNLFADFEALIKTILHIAPTVAAVCPNASAGIEHVTVQAAKADAIASLIHLSVPSLSEGKTDAEITHINEQLPKVVQSVVALKTIYDAVNTPAP